MRPGKIHPRQGRPARTCSIPRASPVSLRPASAASIGCPRRKVTRGLDSFRTYHGVPDPVLLTVCLYPFPRPAHISGQLPAVGRPLRWRREPGKSPSSWSGPRLAVAGTLVARDPRGLRVRRWSSGWVRWRGLTSGSQCRGGRIVFPLWRDVPAGRPLTADERERRILIRSVRPPGLDSRRPGRQPSHPSADVGARTGPCADRLPRRSAGGTNHGKESSKFNQDCTICRTCRWPMADCSVPK